MTARDKAAWETVYELRVEFLEKFPLPWFYEPLLDALGAQGERRGQRASDIVEHGARPLMASLIPTNLHERVAKVALTLERKYPILMARPMEGLAV